MAYDILKEKVEV